MTQRYKKIIVVLAITLLLTLFFTGCIPDDTSISQLENNKNLVVDIIDVGQGESILIRLPREKTMLIDAGSRSESSKVVNYIKDRGIYKIDYLIATHPHEDHIGGMVDVIENFDIGKIYMPKVTHTSKTFKNMLYAIKNKGLKITPAEGGNKILEDSTLSVDILAPNSNKYESLNNYSIVLKITYGKTSFLFTGDAEKISEKEILDMGYNVRADVLNVGHHGSNSSTTKKFLEEVSPQIAVISYGKDNKYGHPHTEVINRLEELGVDIYTTAKHGDISIECDGTHISIK